MRRRWRRYSRYRYSRWCMIRRAWKPRWWCSCPRCFRLFHRSRLSHRPKDCHNCNSCLKNYLLLCFQIPVNIISKEMLISNIASNENVTSDSCFFFFKLNCTVILISDKGTFLAGACFPELTLVWPVRRRYTLPFLRTGPIQHFTFPITWLTFNCCSWTVVCLSVCCRFITTTTSRDYIRHKSKYLHQTGFSGPRFGSDLTHVCRATLTTRSKYDLFSISMWSRRALCASVLRITMFSVSNQQ